jgi:hypothetical protein
MSKIRKYTTLALACFRLIHIEMYVFSPLLNIYFGKRHSTTRQDKRQDDETRLSNPNPNPTPTLSLTLTTINLRQDNSQEGTRDQIRQSKTKDYHKTRQDKSQDEKDKR